MKVHLKETSFFFSNYFLPNDLKVINKIAVGIIEFRREIKIKFRE